MWDDIQIYLDEEETINLNSQIDVCDSHHPYKLHTLVTVPSSGQAVKNPHVLCLSSLHYFVIAIDASVSVLSADCKGVLFHLNFDSVVDCVDIIENGNILLVGERKGVFHILNIPDHQKLISQCLGPADNLGDQTTFTSGFFMSEKDGNAQIVVTSKDNCLSLFSHLNLNQLCKVHKAKDMKLIQQQVQPSLTHKQFNLSEFCPNLRGAFHMSSVQGTSVLGVYGSGKHCMGLGVNEEGIFETLMPSDCFQGGEIKKVQMLRNGRYFVVLDGQNNLNIICAVTFLVITVWKKQAVKDFVLVETIDPVSLSVTDCKVALLTLPTTAEAESYLEIHQFPSFELIYSVCVSSFAFLVNTFANQEYVYLLEGVKTNETGDTGVISCLRVRAVIEEQPKMRLDKLISKHKFEEAEKFACSFGLDTQIVYRAMVASLLDSHKLQHLTQEDVHTTLKKLDAAVSKIKKPEFVIQCCLQANMPSLEIKRHFLLFARKIMEKCQDQVINDQEILKEINQTLHRLATLQCAFLEEDVQYWCLFLTADILEEIITLLNCGKSMAAFFVWERHQNELAESLTVDKIDCLLQAIPDSLQSKDLMLFFADTFLPSVLYNVPDALDIIAKWLIDRVYKMEISEKTYWPDNGRELLQMFLDTCNVQIQLHQKGSSGITIYLETHILQRKAIDESLPISSVKQLISTLESLSMQRKILGCYLPLAHFCQKDKMSVVFLILDRVLVKELPLAIKQYLSPYMSQHNLVEDSVFLQYIENVLRTSPCSWWSWEAAPWEEKLLALINCMQNLDFKMSAIITVASQASIPWSPALQSLIDHFLALDHPRKEILEIQIKFADLKIILMKYKLLNYNYSDNRKAELLINYILKQGQAAALDDALKVIKVYTHLSDIDVYLCHMRNLLKQQNFDAFSETLTSLEPEQLLCCGLRFVDFVCHFLDSGDYCTKDERLQFQMFTLGAIHLLKVLHRLFPNIEQERNEQLDLFERIYCLQTEFSVYLSLSQLERPSFCWELLLNKMDCFVYAEEVLEEERVDDRKCQRFKNYYYHLYRLGELLGFCREKVMGYLAIKFAHEGESALAIELCSELVSSYPSSQTAKSLLHLAKYFSSQIINVCKPGSEDKSYLIPVIHTMASQSLAYCDSGIILQCVDLCQWTSFLNNFVSLSRHCGFPSNVMNNVALEKSPHLFTHWKFSSMYKDHGMNVDLASTIPLLAEFFSESFKDVTLEDKIEPTSITSNLQVIFDVSYQLILMLRTKGQEEAALGCLIKMTVAVFSVCTREDDGADSELSNCDLWTKMEYLFEDLVLTLVLRIVDQPSVDLPLAFGLISNLGRKRALAILKKMVTLSDYNYHRLVNIAAMALEYARMKQLPQVIVDYEDLYIRAQWGIKLGKLHISFREAFPTSAQEEKHHLLEKMVQNPKVTTKILQDYCSAFVLDLDDALVAYLKSLLLGVNAHYYIDNSEINNPAMQQTLCSAEKIITDIKNKEFLLDMLKELLHKIDPYCYESLIFVHKQISNISTSLHTSAGSMVEKGLELLKFLQVYTRTSTPSEQEIDFWLAENPEYDSLPAIATSRLPFHLLTGAQAWNIISPELSAKTAKKWLTVTSLLKLPSDQLLMLAAKNSVTSWLSKIPSKQQGSWNYHIPDSSFLTSVETLLMKITDPEKAIACANYVIKRLPTGATKVSLAKTSVKLAQQWKAVTENLPQIKEVVRKLTTLYQRSTAEHILYKNGLDTPDAISLCRDPKQLIVYLIEKMNHKNIFEDTSKIHFAVDEIAATISYNLSDTYTTLLNKWLPPMQTSRYCGNESINLTEHLMGFQDYPSFDEEDEQNLQRVICLFKNVNKEDSTLQLLNFALEETINETHQLRALRCLFSLIDSETITAVSGHDSTVLWNRLRQLLYITQLKALYLPYSTSVLDNCNKAELVEIILKCQGNNPKALMLSASLCIEHKLYHPNLWNQIFQNMETLHMVDNLKFLLQFHGRLAHLWHSPPYIHAWNTLLLSPFRTGKASSPTQDKEQYLPSYILLLRCPCFSDVDLISLSEEFRLHNLLIPGLGCLLLEHDIQKKTALIKKFQAGISLARLEEEMKCLQEQGVKPAYLLQVKSVILSLTK